MAAQGYESTLFQLLRLHSQTVEAMDVADNSGRDCFIAFVTRVGEYMKRREASRETVTQAWETTFRKNQADLGQYFRSLELLLEYLCDASHDKLDAYRKIVRAQFSDQELAVIFYHYSTETGEGSCRTLIMEHGLFKGWVAQGPIPVPHLDVLPNSLLLEIETL